jgi:multiple sugar transport system permease protein
MTTRLRVGTYLGAIALGAWVIVPFYLLSIAAFTAPDHVVDYPKAFLPATPSTNSLEAFRDSAGIGAAALNSLAVAAIAIGVSLATAIPAALALGRLSFRGRTALLALASLGRFFPIALLAVPVAVALSRVGLYDNVVAVGLMHATIALPFAVLVMARAFARARPLAGIAAAAVLTFLVSWNEVSAAAVLTVQLRTLPAQVFASLATSPLSYKVAAALVLIVPSLLAYLAIRRQFIRVWS